MKLKKILVVLMVLVTMFCMTVPAFAYGSGYTPSGSSSGSSPYGTPGTTSQSPYQSSGTSSSSSPYISSSSGGSSSTGSGMPGSGTSGGSSYGSGMPGSGTSSGSGTSGYGGTSGSGSGSFGSSSASGGSTGSSGNEFFNASIDSSGSLTLSVPTASGTGNSSTPSSLSDSISLILQKYKNIGGVILGICVITSILCLLWQITKLGAAGDNQRSRSMAIKGILISGAAIAIFGSITLVAGIFWGAFV